MSTNEQRQNATWDQTVGSGKEMLGNITGYEGLRQEGIDQNARGKQAEAQGQLQDLGAGATDRVVGGVNKVKGAVTGDRVEEQKAENIHDAGKRQQKEAEAEINKRN
ncbi:hypothetical protein BJX99DRAFT_263650 [Aspergillus californicus]